MSTDKKTSRASQTRAKTTKKKVRETTKTKIQQRQRRTNTKEATQ